MRSLFSHPPCRAAVQILERGLSVCCGILFCALALLLYARPFSLDTYSYYRAAETLQQLSLTVFTVTGFLACFIQEQSLK